jgi:hypothetical protein
MRSDHSSSKRRHYAIDFIAFRTMPEEIKRIQPKKRTFAGQYHHLVIGQILGCIEVHLWKSRNRANPLLPQRKKKNQPKISLQSHQVLH